jgi:hypothetical protein
MLELQPLIEKSMGLCDSLPTPTTSAVSFMGIERLLSLSVRFKV